MPASIPSYTIYNDPAFSRFVAEYFGWEHHVLKIMDHEEALALLPFVKAGKQWISVPLGSVTGMGAAEERFSEQEMFVRLNRMLDKIEKGKRKKEKGKKEESSVDLQRVKGWIAVEGQEQVQWQFRGFYPAGDHIYEDKVLSVIRPESDAEAQFSIFSSNLRRKVRKAAKNGIRVIHGREELLDDFYAVYTHNCHRLGSPFFKKDFYRGLLNAYPETKARFFVAKIQEKVVGASLLLGYKAYWENIYFATTRKFNTLYPSYLLNWSMISYAIEQKAKIYSFGRSTLNSGTHHYKKQWGTEDLPLYWSYSHPHSRNIRQLAFLAEVWKRLPYGFCRVVGPGLAKKVL